MRTRLLRMSLLATFITTPVFAVDDHIADQLSEYALLTTAEKGLVTALVNGLPTLSIPKVGDNSKETIVLTEKYSVKLASTSKVVLTGSCVTTITMSHKVLRVDYPNFYVHSTQTIKMAPAECALDDEGYYDVPGLTFGAGITSRITKSSVPEAKDFTDLLGKWDSWTLGGKKVSYKAAGESEPGYVFSESGAIDLGAVNYLCVTPTSTYTEKGTSEDVYPDDGSANAGADILISSDIKEVSTSACQAAKVVFGGKTGTDILTTSTVGDGVEYCIDDEANEYGKSCNTDVSLLGEGTEFEDPTVTPILEGLPSLVSEEPVM